MIKRIYSNLETLLEPNKVIVLYGPRRVGKTTLLQQLAGTTKLKYRMDTGDDLRVQASLSSQSTKIIQDYVGANELLIIDEAQNIPNIGMGLKLIVDHFKGIKVIATGSASFDLANKIGEPLVGRKWTKILYPLSQYELQKQKPAYDLQSELENYLIFGSYPEVLTSQDSGGKARVLLEISNSYMLKDVLALERIKNSLTLAKLLKLLAFQIGSEVSYSELGSQLSIDRKTVERYLDLLEKTFIIVSLSGFSRNLRKAISKKHKYFFWDNGIRNALINNFNSLDTRNDVGQLWENFLVIERLKKQSYHPIYANNYFFRTWDKKEIDWVEMREGRLFGYEFKYKSSKQRHQDFWLSVYPKEAVYKLVNISNYLSFVA